jgi:hypothetical protein
MMMNSVRPSLVTDVAEAAIVERSRRRSKTNRARIDMDTTPQRGSRTSALGAVAAPRLAITGGGMVDGAFGFSRGVEWEVEKLPLRGSTGSGAFQPSIG